MPDLRGKEIPYWGWSVGVLVGLGLLADVLLNGVGNAEFPVWRAAGEGLLAFVALSFAAAASPSGSSE